MLVPTESMCDLQNAACAAARNHHHVTASHLGPCLTLSGGCAWYNASCPRTNDYKCGSTGYTYREWLCFNLSRLMTKPTKWDVRPAKTQISVGIRPV